MLQKEINIGQIKVPVIEDNNEVYYPISYIMKKVLFKKTIPATLQKEYSQYIFEYKIDYGFDTGGVQNVNCISEEGLKLVLKNSKVGRLSVEQKKAMNILLEYLGMDVISEDGRFIKKLSVVEINKYNTYIRDCIDYVLQEQLDIVWQKCTKCDNYYPYHENFFKVNQHCGKDYPLNTVCRNCGWGNTRSKDMIIHPNDELRIVYNKYGEDAYLLYRNHNVIDIYKHWLSVKDKMFPRCINNESDKLKIIKYYYDNGLFEGKEIISKTIYDVCKFRVSGNAFINRIHKELFGVVLKNGVEYIDNIEDARKIFNTYINDNNITISNVYDIDYFEVIKKSHLLGYMQRRYNNNILGLVMDLYDNKYPAYKFTTRGQKYWDDKEHRIQALKYLIEQDIKIPLQKVPLYVTLTALRNNGTTTMYTVCKKYYHKLFEWVNEVYPGEFNEKDFDIHYVRNNFDSIEEAEVHDILKKTFKSVIYNPRNTDRTVIIDGMIPDWLVFTREKCYIVEYFGICIGDHRDNKRIHDYKNKTIKKIEKYNKLGGYGKVFLYPDDLKNNYSGLKEKLKMIV